MHIVIFVTAADKKEANLIAQALVRKRLAACVNIIADISSLFWWEGKTDSATESLLMIKSKRSKFPSIVKLVKSLHSYEVPEIIALPIITGEKRYLRWLDESIR